MVILPDRVFKSIPWELKSHVLKTRGENVTPKHFNDPWTNQHLFLILTFNKIVLANSKLLL